MKSTGEEGVVGALTFQCYFSSSIAPFQGSPTELRSLWKQSDILHTYMHVTVWMPRPFKGTQRQDVSGSYLRDQGQRCMLDSAKRSDESVVARKNGRQHPLRTWL